MQKPTKPDTTACQEYFSFLDGKSKGYLTKDDFRAYFQAEYHYPSDRDLQSLMHFFLSYDYPVKRDAVSFREWDAALRPHKYLDAQGVAEGPTENFLKRLELNLKPKHTDSFRSDQSLTLQQADADLEKEFMFA